CDIQAGLAVVIRSVITCVAPGFSTRSRRVTRRPRCWGSLTDHPRGPNRRMDRSGERALLTLMLSPFIGCFNAISLHPAMRSDGYLPLQMRALWLVETDRRLSM